MEKETYIVKWTCFLLHTASHKVCINRWFPSPDVIQTTLQRILLAFPQRDRERERESAFPPYTFVHLPTVQNVCLLIHIEQAEFGRSRYALRGVLLEVMQDVFQSQAVQSLFSTSRYLGGSKLFHAIPDMSPYD